MAPVQTDAEPDYEGGYSTALAFSVGITALVVMFMAFAVSLVKGHGEGTLYALHIVCAVVYVLAFVVYYSTLLHGGVIRTLYRNGWWALCAHMLIPTSLVPLAVILLGPQNGGMLAVPYLVLVGYYINRTGGWWFSIKEADSATILFGERPICVPWMYSGYVGLKEDPRWPSDMVIPWTFLRIEEMYVEPDCHDGSKLIDLPRAKQVPYLAGKKTVWYKRDVTRRDPRENVVLELTSACFAPRQLSELRQMYNITDDGVEHPVQGATLPETKFPLSLSHEKILFLITGKEISLRDAEVIYGLKVLEAKKTNLECHKAELIKDDDTQAYDSLEQKIADTQSAIDAYKMGKPYLDALSRIPDEDIQNTIGIGFWSFVDGFYFLLDGVAKPIGILKTAVLHERVTPVGVPTRIQNVDVGVSHLYGSHFYKGPSWLFKIHGYVFKWRSPSDPAVRTEYITWTRLKTDIFIFELHNAEAIDQFKLDFVLAVTMRIVNPFVAHFRIENFMENLSTLILQQYRLLVGTAKFADIYTGYNSFGVAWWSLLKIMLCDPKGSDIRRRTGVQVDLVTILDVSPSGMSPEEAARAQAKAWLAERDAVAIGILAKAEADRIETVFTAVENKKSGFPLKYLEMMTEVAQGQGNIVMLGSLQSTIDEFMSGNTSKAARTLAELGITGDQVEKLVAMIAKGQLKKGGGE